MANHRIKHTFTSGETSPLLSSRLDFSRYNNGAARLHNMVCLSQGPCARRSGMKYIYDLTSLGMSEVDDPENGNVPQIRMIPFVFSQLQAYALIFYKRASDGRIVLVFGANNGLVLIDSNDPCPPTILDDPNAVPGTVIGGIEPAAIGDIASVVMPVGFDIDNFDYAQSADNLYIAQGGAKPLVLRRYRHDCWQLVSLTFTDQPTDWSTENGWPERVTYHQQRLCFAANKIRRQTVWMSKAGSYHDFGTTTGTTTDADAVTFTLDSGTQNSIRWMISGKTLNIGTIANEWTVSGGNRVALTPSNIIAQRQTNRGSEPLTPLMIGITTMFVQRYGRSVNEFVYDFNNDSYTTTDMSILSTHVTETNSIVDWAYQQTPDSIIWCIRDDGAMLGITYQRQHEVVGWHVHSSEAAQFKAITSIPGLGREDEIWTAVRRDIGNPEAEDYVPNYRHYIEIMAERFVSEDIKDARFMDSYIVKEDEAGFTEVDVPHLAFQAVQVLADGAVHPPLDVVDGKITLNATYKHVVVGLTMVSEVWPNLPEIKSQEGTSHGRMQRITNLSIDFFNTLGIYIGRYSSEDGETMEEYPFRIPGDLTGEAVPLFNGIYHIAYPEGFDRNATYFIRQVQPLPLTVLAVTDTIEILEE